MTSRAIKTITLRQNRGRPLRAECCVKMSPPNRDAILKMSIDAFPGHFRNMKYTKIRAKSLVVSVRSRRTNARARQRGLTTARQPVYRPRATKYPMDPGDAQFYCSELGAGKRAHRPGGVTSHGSAVRGKQGLCGPFFGSSSQA